MKINRRLFKKIQEAESDKDWNFEAELFGIVSPAYKALFASYHTRPFSSSLESIYREMKNIWFFLYSDKSYLNGKFIKKKKRSQKINGGTSKAVNKQFDVFLYSEVTYDSKKDGEIINEVDFIEAQIAWTDKVLEEKRYEARLEKVYRDFLEFLKKKQAIQGVSNKSSDNQFHKLTDKASANSDVIPVNIDHQEAKNLFNILKLYFDSKHHSELQNMLLGFSDVNQKLLFNGQGNQFTDAFKKIYESNLISGSWTKKQMGEWIERNFQFNHKGKAADFKYDTIEKTISGRKTHCKKPIIKISDGKIIKATK